MKGDSKEYLIQYRRLLQLRGRVEKYEVETIKSMLGIYEKSITDLKQRLKKTRSLETKAQQRKLIREIEKAHKAYSVVLTETMADGVKEVSRQMMDGMIKILSWDKKDDQFSIPAERASTILNAIKNVPIGGKLISDWVTKTFDDTLAIQKEVLAANLSGESYRKMYNRLVDVYPNHTRKELITLARTYNQSAVTSAQETLFEENSDIVKKVRWSAAMEMGYKKSGRGTCASCAALDGNEYRLDEAKPNNPLHARCRCMWSPVTLTWNELLAKHRLTDKDGNPLTLDEMEKPYKSFLTRKDKNIDVGRGKGNILDQEWTDQPYGSFIVGKGKVALINVVGPRRAEMILSGKIDFSDLVDRKTGRLKTLSELGYIPKAKPPVRKKSSGGGGQTNIPPQPASFSNPASLDGVHFSGQAGALKEKYEEALNRLPEDQRKIVNKYQKPTTISIGDGCYYRADMHLISRHDANDGLTLLHEYGHHIDHVFDTVFLSSGRNGYLTGGHGGFLKAYVEDGERLGLKMPTDLLLISDPVEKMRKQQEFFTKRGEKLTEIRNELFESVQKTLSDGRRYTSWEPRTKISEKFSDIIDAITDGDFFDTYRCYGHGSAYYRSRGQLMKLAEVFADLFALRSEAEAWEKIKDSFPSLYNAFEEIIKGAQ